jgi:putative colanic acid biosynthesis acetyltransferase WcaF
MSTPARDAQPVLEEAEQRRRNIAQDLSAYRKPVDYTVRQYLRRTVWEVVERLLVRPSPRFAYGWRRFWIVFFGATIHPTASIRHRVRILHPWLLSVGRHSMIAEGTEVFNIGQLTVGEHTVISQDVYLCGGTHDYHLKHLPLLRTPIVIGSGVWICARATIGPGVSVGDNSVVGLCSLVTTDVPPGMVVAGNPARVIKRREPCLKSTRVGESGERPTQRASSE